MMNNKDFTNAELINPHKNTQPQEFDATQARAIELAIERIRRFNLAESTPMECLNFVTELKRLVNG